MDIKNNDYIKCNFCDLRADVNIQKVWIKFNIDKDGEYKIDKDFDSFGVEEPINDDNLHLCKKHFEKWWNGNNLS